MSLPIRHCRPAAIVALSIALLLAIPLAAPAPAMAQPRDAKALMKLMDELWRGDSSHAIMRMVIKTRHYERQMVMESWSEGTEKAFVRIQEPAKDRGITTLKVERNIYNYLPKINRVTKIPPSMMMTSWMGSHFTNDDLVAESSYQDDYESTISFEGKRDGVDIYEITSIPKPDAAVVWGKIVTIIDKPRLLPVSATFHDEDGELVRTVTYSEPRRFDQRLVPSRMLLRPQDQPEEYTEIIYEQLSFDVDLPAGVFSLQRLKSGR